MSLQRLYREKGENMKHNYTLSGELPEMVQAKLNAMNLSEVKSHSNNTHKILSAAFVCIPSHVQLSLYIFHVCAFSELLQAVLDQDT